MFLQMTHFHHHLFRTPFIELEYLDKTGSPVSIPTLNRVGMDTGDPSNHRPNSNLNTMSKVLERLLISRLMPHVSGNFCSHQSAYRQYPWTETALLRITNGLFEAVDAEKANVLVALDMSAAFDTIDHSVLFLWLEHTFGVGGTALSWLRS